MSLNADITSLSNALQAFTYGQSIVAENLANVDTVGYTAQVLNLESLTDFGGVSVAGVGSTRNTFLYNQIYGQLALQGFTTAQLNALTQISEILPEVANPAATGGLNAAINNLSSAWSALALAPGNTADQTTVVNDMQTLAGLFETDSNQLYTLQQNLNTQVQQSVTQVNALEDQILSLNKQIVDLGGQQSAQTSTLIDQREVAAESLVGLTGASVNYNTDGAMVVTFSGGTLVDGVQSSHLGIINSPTVPGMSDIGYVAVGSNVMEDVTADFSSGTLGGLYSGQSSVRQTVLALNKMASGIIQYSNEVNESTTGPNGDLNALFYGTEAADITVNPDVLANPQLALAGGTDPLNPGNLAAAQAAMTSLNMYAEVESFNSTNINAGGIELNAGVPINPNASLASQAALFSNPNPSVSGVLVINSGLNSVSITWNNSESLNDIIGLINSQSGGAIYATLQTIPNGATVNGQALNPGQYVHIYSNAPMSVYDQSGNLSSALQLVSVLNSSAPINAVPTTGVNQVNPNQPLNYVAPNPNTVDNPLALFTQPVAPPTGGTVEVGGNPADVFTWNPNDTLNTILNSMTTADPNITALFSTPPFTPVQQVSLYDIPGGPNTPGNPLESISIGDLTGNLTQVLNLNTDTNATAIFAQLTTTVRDGSGAAKMEQTQANSLVSATQALQTQQSGVNEDAQLAQAMVYENAYDAAVRMQYVLENMLNYMITGVGSPNGGSNPIGN